MLETMQSIFDRQSDSAKQFIIQVIAKAKTSSFVDVSLKAIKKKLLLPIAAEVHPDISNFGDALVFDVIPDMLMPLDWELIFDRVLVKANKNTSLFAKFIGFTGLDKTIINMIFDTTLSKDTPTELSNKTMSLLFVAAILQQALED